MRSTIFVSHTNSEKDNSFARWINAKLRLFGYDSWCELDRFVGGEECWLEIQKVLKTNTVIFIAVVSKRYCEKLMEGGSGVRMELNFAQKSNEIPNGNIIPVLIDEFSLDELPIEINPFWFIDCKGNWETALTNLLDKLSNEKIPKVGQGDSTLSFWYESIKLDKGIYPKNEIYYSNWWEIKSLPKFLYVFRFSNRKIADKVVHFEAFPCIGHGNHVCSFKDKITTLIWSNGDEIEVSITKVYKVPIVEIIDESYQSQLFPTLLDVKNILKRLLRTCFELLMYNCELKSYKLANKKPCFYYPTGFRENDKIKFDYRGKPKSKKLVGKYFDDMWHFGISSKVQLYPFVGFSLKSHILFSEDGKKLWNDKDKIHSARRKKGKTFFNEQWRDLLFGLLNSLKDEKGKISIPVNENFEIEMPSQTISFQSEFGYLEPNSAERLEMAVIDNFEDEEIEEIEE